MRLNIFNQHPFYPTIVSWKCNFQQNKLTISLTNWQYLKAEKVSSVSASPICVYPAKNSPGCITLYIVAGGRRKRAPNNYYLAVHLGVRYRENGEKQSLWGRLIDGMEFPGGARASKTPRISYSALELHAKRIPM